MFRLRVYSNYSYSNIAVYFNKKQELFTLSPAPYCSTLLCCVAFCFGVVFYFILFYLFFLFLFFLFDFVLFYFPNVAIVSRFFILHCAFGFLSHLLICKLSKSKILRGNIKRDLNKNDLQYGCFKSCQFRPRSVVFVS